MKENRCKEHEETLHLYNTIFLSKTKTKSNIFLRIFADAYPAFIHIRLPLRQPKLERG